ncbi:hypothetical protein [Cribrihabitans neustonicus]|uniref:hypothetical protein n=1 Tax=Cribrihabitans neustonicus TaxID=1429085 RepID=UPI003B5CF9E3
MWSWIQENSATLQLVVSLLTAFVWIAYLHVFVSSYQRQTRSSLLISGEGPHGLKGRCVISNMGSEPAFLMDVLAEFETADKKFTASVIDRAELWESEEGTSDGISAQGPMLSGSYVDIGSFEDVLDRAKRKFNSEDFTRNVSTLRLIAIAATSQARDLAAACRCFEFVFDDGGDVSRIRPIEISAEQIRSRRKRRKLRSLLEEIQKDEVIDHSVSDDLIESRRGLRG